MSLSIQIDKYETKTYGLQVFWILISDKMLGFQMR